MSRPKNHNHPNRRITSLFLSIPSFYDRFFLLRKDVECLCMSRDAQQIIYHSFPLFIRAITAATLSYSKGKE